MINMDQVRLPVSKPDLAKDKQEYLEYDQAVPGELKIRKLLQAAPLIRRQTSHLAGRREGSAGLFCLRMGATAWSARRGEGRGRC